MERTHGGDWAAFQIEYGALPLDFSANISPLGVPEGVRSSIVSAAADADRYPDPLCRSLREAIAKREGVPLERVFCGNGASDLLYRAVWAARPRRALVTAPAFGEYEAALETAGCGILRVPLNGDFRLTDDILATIDHNIDIIILCQPNNPAGTTVAPELLRAIAARCGETGSRLLIDECFIDFLDDSSVYTAKGLLERYPNLLLLKAFTKLYGLAGVRLGYALCADTAFLGAMRLAGPPWAVSSVAQAAGIAALQEKDYVNSVRRLIRIERPWLYDRLSALGLRVILGEANFLLFRSEAALDAPLRERGVLIRRCGDFAGMDDTWYRVAVRTRAENERLIAALGEVLK